MEIEEKEKPVAEASHEAELLRRRDFLKSLKKWSQVVIGGVVLGGLLPGSEPEAGGVWINSRGGWINGGGGGWVNRGGSWVNGVGGGWANRRGGGGWINSR
jgi:hypothetical protein